MNTNIVGKRIKYERQRLNMTLKELGNLLKVSEQCLSSWEHGRNVPDIISLNTLANIFGIEIKDFLTINKLDQENYTDSEEIPVSITLNKRDLQIIAKLRAFSPEKRKAIELLLGIKEPNLSYQHKKNSQAKADGATIH